MFYPFELDTCPAFGWVRDPFTDVKIKTLRSGQEKRTSSGSVIRHRFTLPFNNILDQQYLTDINETWMALGGPEDSFLAKDYLDYRVVAHPLGVAPAGSTPVQLTRVYSKGGATRTRKITKPVAGALIYQNGVLKSGTLSALTGLFTPATAWTPAAVLTWTGEFRVPVRFDQMSLPSSIDNRSGQRLISNGSCSLIEVIGE